MEQKDSGVPILKKNLHVTFFKVKHNLPLLTFTYFSSSRSGKPISMKTFLTYSCIILPRIRIKDLIMGVFPAFYNWNTCTSFSLNVIFVLRNLSIASCMRSSNFYRLWDVLISSQNYQVRLMVVPLLHSAATVRAADELITLQGDLNANWFSILTVEGVAVQLHTANIKLSGSCL